MERITLRVRTTKKDGEVPIMFRLRDTNGVDIYYKSDIAIDVKQLPKLTPEGTAKPRVTTVDLSLLESIKARKALISQAYATMKKKGLDITGPNGNTIFLPADGYRWGREAKDVKLEGDYWTRMPLSQTDARYLYFYSGGVYPLNYNYRSYGFSVRPVAEE